MMRVSIRVEGLRTAPAAGQFRMIRSVMTRSVAWILTV